MPNQIIEGDALTVLRTLEAGSVNCCVTSPPYFGLRDYGNVDQLGLEKTPEEFICKLVAVFHEVKRVLKNNGTLWVVIGDSYAGSWGAQSRANGNDVGSTLEGGSMLSARQIQAHPKGQTHTGSIKNTPGCKPKDLIGIPWMLAFALRADGWYLRMDCIWNKPNPMPESVTDRPTKAHEYLFLLSKSSKYYYDADAIKEPLAKASHARLAQNIAEQKGSDRVSGKTNGAMKAVSKGLIFGGNKARDKVFADDDPMSRGGSEQWGRQYTPSADGNANKKSVWTIASHSFSEAHFATFPPKLIVPCIKAGCPENGVVLDPFFGAGTTGLVAKKLNRNYLGIELNPEYIAIAEKRINALHPSLFTEQS